MGHIDPPDRTDRAGSPAPSVTATTPSGQASERAARHHAHRTVRPRLSLGRDRVGTGRAAGRPYRRLMSKIVILIAALAMAVAGLGCGNSKTKELSRDVVSQPGHGADKDSLFRSGNLTKA